jgi:hypothetical protein
MNNKEIGIRLINNEKVSPQELKELKKNFDMIQVGLDVEQKNNKIKTPQASGKTMQESYD